LLYSERIFIAHAQLLLYTGDSMRVAGVEYG
jgi:hypothetical protein